MKISPVHVLLVWIISIGSLWTTYASVDKTETNKTESTQAQHPAHDHPQTDHIKKLDEGMRKKRKDEE